MRLLVNAKEAAEMLGLSVETFRHRVKGGVGPLPVDLPGHQRWRSADVEAFRERADPALEYGRRPKQVPLGPDVCHLYRHFDKDGRLLYVGISLSAVARLSEHKKGAQWFWQIARIEVTAYATRESALKAERISIKREKPLHNVVHAVKEAA